MMGEDLNNNNQLLLIAEVFTYFDYTAYTLQGYMPTELGGELDMRILENLSLDEKTEAVCLAAVQQSGFELKYVPNNMKTEAMCLAAVQQLATALLFVPDNMKTEAVCLAAVQGIGSVLKYVPNNMKTEAMCLAAVQKNGAALEYFPDNMKTEAMCLAAVQQNGAALKYFPDNMKTEAICLAAVQRNGAALKSVPDNMKTEAMCLAAAQQNGAALEYFPDNMKTEAICLAAVQQNGLALKSVPDNMKTEAMCLAAMQQWGWALEYVPDNMKTEAMCLAAVQQLGLALEFVPDNMKTEAVCLAAVQQLGLALEFVPDNMKTKALFLAALIQDSSALKDIIEWASKKGHTEIIITLLDAPEIDVNQIYKNASALLKLFKADPELISVLTKDLNLEPSVMREVIILIGRFLPEDAINKLPASLGDKSTVLANLIMRPEKRMLADKILGVQASSKKIDRALLEEVGGNESSMNDSMTRTANAHFQNKVKPHFKKEFEGYGKSQDERLDSIEKEIRSALLDKIQESLLLDFERSAPDAGKVISEVIQFIEENKEKLIAADPSTLKQAREKYFTSNKEDAQIAWRGYDPGAPTAGWPNLLTHSNDHAAEEKIFTTQASSQGVSLNQDDAVSILRERAAYYFLAAKQMENIDQFASYMALIRRAHNDDAHGDNQKDNPSCFPGQITRIAMIGQGHYIAELPRSAKEIIEDEMQSIVTEAFQAALKKLPGQEKEDLYHALVMVNELNAKEWLEKPSVMDGYENKWLRSRQEFVAALSQAHDSHLTRIDERIEKQLGRPLLATESRYISLLPFNSGGSFVSSLLTNMYLTSRDSTPQIPVLEVNPFPLKDYAKTLASLPVNVPNRGIRAKDQVMHAWDQHYCYETTLSVLAAGLPELSREQISQFAENFTEEYSGGENFHEAFSSALRQMDQINNLSNDVTQTLQDALNNIQAYSPDVSSLQNAGFENSSEEKSDIEEKSYSAFARSGLFSHTATTRKANVSDEKRDDQGPKRRGP